ncbi:hypothetical protein RUND412_006186 [Rhizina undulata]
MDLPVEAVTASVVGAITSYFLLVRYLRFWRVDELEKKLGYAGVPIEEIYKKMTLEEAQMVQNTMGQLEFPRLFEASLQFALFRTYAIPTISALLLKTRQFSSKATSSKRYADTSVLVSEFIARPFDSERSSLAIARMNYLHSQYPAILPRDTLYTLLLFSTQPIVFISRYEWRQPRDFERVALWKYWTELGVRIGVPREDIPSTWHAMAEWSEKFEQEYMVPDHTNNEVGLKTIDLLLYYVPSPLQPYCRPIVATLMDERLRNAMMLPHPPRALISFVNGIFALRAFLTRHTHLPRFIKLCKTIEKPNPETGKYNFLNYEAEPWYISASVWNRYGPWSWVARIMGWPVMAKGKYGEDGYVIEEIGPDGFKGRGIEKVREEAEKIRKMGGTGGGCPFG